MKVLFVDDEPDFLEQAEHFLEEKDDRLGVETATSADEGLKILGEEDYDAVASDYKMPEKNGLEFLEELRENGDDIPFIILTGKGREEVAMKALNLGADRYFQKTGDPDNQFSMLADALVKEIKNRWTEDRNKYLNTLLSHDLKKNTKVAKENLDSLKDLNLPSKADKYLETTSEAIKSGIELIEETEATKNKTSEEKVSDVILRSLNRFLGFAYWSESQLQSSNLLNLYRRMEEYKDTLMEIAHKSAEHRSLLEEMGSNLEHVDLEKSVQENGVEELDLEAKTEDDIIADLKRREKFKLNVYKKLRSSTNSKTISKVWKGENPQDYFGALDRLIEGKKQNIKLFERIEKKRFLGVSPGKKPAFSYL